MPADTTKKIIIISLGGSLIIPDEINADFLRRFKKLILDQVQKGKKFIIICGGGQLCRKYNQALKKISKPGNIDLDWMGIQTTWTNAKLIQLMFGKSCHAEISTDPTKIIKFKQPILIGGGWKPGRSSDGAMIQYAKTYKANIAINLSNIDYVFDKDPHKYKNAKLIRHMYWPDFLKIVGNRWKPGANVPFDPTAAMFAYRNNIKVIITNGNNLKNLKKILEDRKFSGTQIE